MEAESLSGKSREKEPKIKLIVDGVSRFMDDAAAQGEASRTF